MISTLAMWSAYLVGISIAATLVLSFVAVFRAGEILWELKLIRRDLHYLRLDVLSEKNPPARVNFKENAFKKDN